MKILSERAKETLAGMGAWGYDAEVEVQEFVNQMPKTYYVYAGEYNEGLELCVSTKSVYDYLAGPSDDMPEEEDMLEKYDTFEDAKASRFSRYFEIAQRMLDEVMGNE